MTQPPEHPDPTGPTPGGQPPSGPPSWEAPPSPLPPTGPPPPSWSPSPPPGPPSGPPSGPPPGPTGPPGYAPPPSYGAPPPPWGGYPGWTPGAPPPPPRKSKLPLVLGVVAAVVVLGIAIAVPVVLTSQEDDEAAGGDPTPSASDTAGTDSTDAPSTDLSEVKTFDGLETTHVTEVVPYEQVPPVGGPHFGQWLDCGVYDRPVPDEVAVHDLEHGTVWITYDADALTPDDVLDLEDYLPQNGILSPYEGLDSPVVVTVWERQLALTGPDDPRLPLFLSEFSGGVTAPEPMASCAGGLSADEADAAAGLLSS